MKEHNVYRGLQRKPSILNNIENFLEATSASAYLKAKNGSYLDVNNVFVRISNMHPDNVIGRNDLDLIWREQAPIMMGNDQEVLFTEKAKTVIEPVQTLDGIKHFLNHKAPLCTKKGRIIGVFGLAFLIDQENTISSTLNEMSSLMEPWALRVNHCIQSLINRPSKDRLSQRQIDCLYYLVQGKTAKQIASILNLSHRTIEHHIDALKIKYQCRSRSELIGKALQLSCIKYRLCL